MGKMIKWLFLGLLLGALGGFIAGIVAFPYLFPPAPVNEVVQNKEDKNLIATAEFIHANPSDPIHYGKGGLSVYDNLLHLEANFEVGPGPKYHVYLVPIDPVTPETAVEESMFVDLGRLKAFSGSQNYPIPAGVTLSDYQSVVIWCEQFGVLISPATLTFSQ